LKRRRNHTDHREQTTDPPPRKGGKGTCWRLISARSQSIKADTKGRRLPGKGGLEENWRSEGAEKMGKKKFKTGSEKKPGQQGYGRDWDFL